MKRGHAAAFGNRGSPNKVALAPFLSSCPEVVTLGIRPSMEEYTPEERDLLLGASRIFFPTPRFADLFQALGIATFPRPTTYRYQRSRVLQQLLFQYMDCPHEKTRIYHGRRKARIPQDFPFPFLLLSPWTRSAASFLVSDPGDFLRTAPLFNPVLARRKVAWRERWRLLWVGFQCLGGQRLAPFESGGPSFEPVPLEPPFPGGVMERSRDLLLRAGLDDIVVEWGQTQDGEWKIIGLSRPPVKWETPGGVVHRHEHIARLIMEGKL